MSSNKEFADAGEYFVNIINRVLLALEPDLAQISDSGVIFSNGGTYNSISLPDGYNIPDEVDFYNKFREYDTENEKYAIKYLKQLRETELVNSDKYALPDYPHTSEEIKQSWFQYRQDLRDLPANNPHPLINIRTLELENVVWPTKPNT